MEGGLKRGNEAIGRSVKERKMERIKKRRMGEADEGNEGIGKNEGRWKEERRGDRRES